MPQSNIPYGDAYLVNTPNIDRVGQMMIADQKQRDLIAQREQQMLDAEMSRNMSGMKDVDIPILTDKWGKYKQLKQELYRNGNKMSNNERIQKQLEAQRALGESYQTINSSKADLERIKMHYKGVDSDKKGMYADDARQKLAMRMNTPTNQISPNSENELMYQYYFPDFDKVTEAAWGKPKDRVGETYQSKTDPLKDETVVFKGLRATPNEYYNNLFTGLAVNGHNKNATGVINHSFSSDAEVEDIKNRYYQKIKDPAFIAAYGETKPFPESAQYTDLGQAVALQTMKKVVDAPIPTPKIESSVNKTRSIDAQNQEWTRRLGIKDAQWLRHNKITYNQALNKIQVNNDKAGTYEVNDLPAQLLEKTEYMNIPGFGNTKVINIADLSEGDKADVKGKAEGPMGIQLRNGFMVNGKEYLIPLPNGEFAGDGWKTTDRDIQLNTIKRTTPLEKPIGTNKAKLRGNENKPAVTKGKAGITWKK